VRATEGFSGAELEQVVISALYLAFAEGEETRLADRHLETAIAASIPLSQSMGSRLALLRQEARDKWRPASGGPEAPALEEVSEAVISEPPPVSKKPKRIFDV
jgi:hypothetical protein